MDFPSRKTQSFFVPYTLHPHCTSNSDLVSVLAHCLFSMDVGLEMPQTWTRADGLRNPVELYRFAVGHLANSQMF